MRLPFGFFLFKFNCFKLSLSIFGKAITWLKHFQNIVFWKVLLCLGLLFR